MIKYELPNKYILKFYTFDIITLVLTINKIERKLRLIVS